MRAETCDGKPCVVGTSVDVATIVGTLGNGKSFEDVEEMFQLNREQVLAALRYASYVTDHLPLRMPPSGSVQKTE